MRFDTRSVARSVVLVALVVVLSYFSIPFGPAKLLPWQSFVNVIAGVLLGPWWALAIALVASILRNLLGTGTINAFDGSMIGALLVGLIYRATRNIYLAAAGEIIGTGVLAAAVSTWVVSPFLHKTASLHLFLYIFLPAFMLVAVLGAALGVAAIHALAAAGIRPENERRVARVPTIPSAEAQE